MSYTPVEIRHVRVPRRPLGYDRATVEQILSEVADSFETVWRDRAELADKVEQLQRDLEQAKQREQLLTNTLVAAEHAADEMRARAKREADLIVSEAHAEARSVMHSGQSERERLLAEVRRIESLLRSALGIVAEANPPDEVPAVEAAAPPPAQPAPKIAPAQIAPAPIAPAAVVEARQPEPAPQPPSPGPAADEAQSVAAEEPPGWPPLRKVAQGGADFDWGD